MYHLAAMWKEYIHAMLSKTLSRSIIAIYTEWVGDYINIEWVGYYIYIEWVGYYIYIEWVGDYIYRYEMRLYIDR